MDIEPAFGLTYHNFDQKFKRCGCYIRNPSVLENVKPKTHVAIPLKHIDYDIEVTNGLVSTTLQQKYFNPTQKYLEIDFSFPIDPRACIYKFVAEFGNKRIEGVVKEKEEAKKEYKEAVQQGRQAVYAEIDQNSKDILNMEIGNLAPSQELKITISYLQELNIEQNTFYQLHIPSTISPRYMNDIKGRQVAQKQLLQKIATQSVQGKYTWTFKITLLTSRKLAYYVSHSHNLQLISQNEAKTETILCLAKEEKPNVDLALLFTVEDFHLPSYVLGRTDVSCTAMLSFIPKFCQLSLDDAMKASMVKKELETDMSAAKGEYIFLLDRSGSMGGKRIDKAKQALTLFLQSLPQDTYFNVVSFGDGSNFMFKQSIKYTKDSLQTAVKNIKPMRADMGGTEIYNPLLKILQTKVIEGYPKQIFLLTDGGVSNTQGVINLVGKQVKYSRCHSIGIGNGCSEALIKGCAEKGKGKFIFITDSENPSEKIIGLLEETLTPVIDHVTLKYDKDLVHSIVPNPESLPYILKNQVVNFYITFKNQLDKKTSFTFGYTDSMNKSPFSTNIEIDPEAQNMPFVDKMAHNKIIKNLEIAAKDNKPIEEYMYYVKVVDKKKQAIDHSVKHQILSEYTAFICVGKELVDGKLQQMKDIGSQKVQIQPVLPECDLQQKEAFDMCVSSFSSYKMLAKCNQVAMLCDQASILVKQQQYQMDDLYSIAQNLKCQGAVKKKSSTFGSLLGAIGDWFSSSSSKKTEKKESIPKMNVLRDESMGLEKCQMNNKTAVNSLDQESFNQKLHIPPPPKISFNTLPPPPSIPSMIIPTLSRMQISKIPPPPILPPAGTISNNIPMKIESFSVSNKDSNKQSISIEEVIRKQNVDGSFVDLEVLRQIFPLMWEKVLKQSQERNVPFEIVVSYAVAKWIEINYPQKQYALIAKKALSYVKKSFKLEDLQYIDLILQ